MEIIIRDANAADIAAIEYLVEAGYRKDEAKEGWTHETDLLSGDRLAAGEIAATLADENSHTLVAQMGETVVGTICVTNSAGVFEFGKFAVKPNLQGHGVGKKLINAVESIVANKWGGKKLQLSVISIRKELVDFYARYGFKDTGKRLDFVALHPYVVLKKNVPNLEVIIMEKAVSQ